MATEPLDGVLARLAALEAKVEELQAPDARSAASNRESEQPVSRRRLIGMAGAAAAGAVGATVAVASPAGADDPNDVTIDASKAGVGTTTLSSNFANQPAFVVQHTAPSGTSGTTGVEGRVGTGGAGVRGTAAGDLSQGGAGVRGQGQSGRAVGVFAGAVGDGGSLVVEAPGNAPATSGAHLKLLPASAPGAPTGSGAMSAIGSFYLDQAGVLWQCVVAGNPGTWVRQSPLVTLASPVRIYYSLTAGDPPLGNLQERSVTVTNGTTIPHSASAVLTNLAVTPSGADGFLAMFKHGTTWPMTSNLNYSAGVFASNNATSAVALDLGTGKVRIHCGGGAVHFVIDVFGYYP